MGNENEFMPSDHEEAKEVSEADAPVEKVPYVEYPNLPEGEHSPLQVDAFGDAKTSYEKQAAEIDDAVINLHEGLAKEMRNLQVGDGHLPPWYFSRDLGSDPESAKVKTFVGKPNVKMTLQQLQEEIAHKSTMEYHAKMQRLHLEQTMEKNFPAEAAGFPTYSTDGPQTAVDPVEHKSASVHEVYHGGDGPDSYSREFHYTDDKEFLKQMQAAIFDIIDPDNSRTRDAELFASILPYGGQGSLRERPRPYVPEDPDPDDDQRMMTDPEEPIHFRSIVEILERCGDMASLLMSTLDTVLQPPSDQTVDHADDYGSTGKNIAMRIYNTLDAIMKRLEL